MPIHQTNIPRGGIVRHSRDHREYADGVVVDRIGSCHWLPRWNRGQYTRAAEHPAGTKFECERWDGVAHGPGTLKISGQPTQRGVYVNGILTMGGDADQRFTQWHYACGRD
jgi:hypothetical protein